MPGFEVVGVDIVDQPRYPFGFHQADAMTYPLDGFDAIHASPPCQFFSDMRTMGNARDHEDLLTPTRRRLETWGGPWAIENVEGAPMDTGQSGFFTATNGVVLCGSMFDLETEEYRLQRHRLFESNVPLPRVACHHNSKAVVGIYGDHARLRRRVVGSKDRGLDIVGNAQKLALVRELMGIDWMTWTEANQAIPPAYTEFVGGQLLSFLRPTAVRSAVSDHYGEGWNYGGDGNPRSE